MSNKKSSEIFVNTKEGGRENIRCVSLLRIIPGKREVYDALWENRHVIAKIFSDWLQANRHLKREWEGLKNLQKLKINAPAALFFGTTDDGKRVLVTEKITDSVSSIDTFLNAATQGEKLKLLLAICRETARENESGIVQKDLHLGNFLIKEKIVYAIDVAQMRFFDKPLTKEQSIRQLAFPTSHLANEPDAVKEMAREYFRARGWELQSADEEKLKKEIEKVRKKYIKKTLKKSLRTSRNFLKIKSGQYEGMFDKSFIGDAEPMEFIKRIDSLMEGGQILKRGNTSFVSRINFNDRDIVVKRYNHKGLIHSLRHTMLRSRARRSWLNGHLLLMLNIPTPNPVGFIEKRKGPILWQSYLITEHTEGIKLYDFLLDANNKQREKINLQFSQLLDKLGKNFITHGDMKVNNILIGNDKLTLTDLDSIKIHRFNFAYQRKRQKDIERLSAISSVSYENLPESKVSGNYFDKRKTKISGSNDIVNLSKRPDAAYYKNTRTEMLRFIPKNVRATLEIGCGYGIFSSMLKSRFGAETWGIELDKHSADMASTRLNKVINADVSESLPQIPDGYFDCIILFDILEHLADPCLLLTSLKQKLKKTGIIVISIPNVRHYENYFNFLIRGNWDYQDAGILDKTHLRFFTFKSILKMFASLNYEVIHIEGINGTDNIKLRILNTLLFRALEDLKYLQFAVIVRPIQNS